MFAARSGGTASTPGAASQGDKGDLTLFRLKKGDTGMTFRIWFEGETAITGEDAQEDAQRAAQAGDAHPADCPADRVTTGGSTCSAGRRPSGRRGSASGRKPAYAGKAAAPPEIYDILQVGDRRWEGKIYQVAAPSAWFVLMARPPDPKGLPG